MTLEPPRLLEAFRFEAERVLVPLDLARCSMGALALANQFARRFDARVTLLYVVPHPGRERDSQPDGLEFRQAEACLRRLGDRHLRSTVTFSARVRAGLPAAEILAEITDGRADLLVLPLHHRTLLRRLLRRRPYGQTSRDVIAGARCQTFICELMGEVNWFKRWRNGHGSLRAVEGEN
ncbi:MAG TPA: universal stress protein [Opitutaceae bacterium]|nr:universal stress protein [Opitutaceae bacterium]